MTGFPSSSQNVAPSISDPGMASTKTSRPPASARIRGTWRASSGERRRAFSFSTAAASFSLEYAGTTCFSAKVRTRNGQAICRGRDDVVDQPGASLAWARRRSLERMATGHA